MRAAAVAAVAAAVVAEREDPWPEVVAAAAEVQAVGAEGVRMTDCCRTALLTEESTEVVVFCQHLHNAVGCMKLVEGETVACADPADIHCQASGSLSGSVGNQEPCFQLQAST